MRILVDLNKCLGYAQCVFLAPDVFKLSGEEALMYDPNPDDAKRLRVLRPATACPVGLGGPTGRHQRRREIMNRSAAIADLVSAFKRAGQIVIVGAHSPGSAPLRRYAKRALTGASPLLAMSHTSLTTGLHSRSRC